VSLGQIFSVNVTITAVANLTAWEFRLYYLSSVLNCSGVVEGPFLKTGGNNTFFTKMITNSYNSTHGRVIAGCALTGVVPGATGSGTLVTITFRARSGGETSLHLSNTKLGDEKIPPQPIPHTPIDGMVHVTGTIHDVAIKAVSPFRALVGEGFSANISVNTENQGDFIETFNVAVYADLELPIGDEIVIGEQTISNLPAGALRSTTYVWNTTGVTRGNYTISATAEVVPGESDFYDNNCTDGWVLVTKVGDFGGNVPPQFFRCDGKVDGKDLALFLQCYHETAPPEAMYLGDLGGGVPPQFFKSDNEVDGKDLALFLLCFKG
jgi:hypothetical protein